MPTWLKPHRETVSCWVGAVVMVLGLLAFLVVWLRWHWVADWYRELWPKLLVAAFRFLAAGAAVAGKNPSTSTGGTAAEDGLWVTTLFVPPSASSCG
jgi:hypothetical protein